MKYKLFEFCNKQLNCIRNIKKLFLKSIGFISLTLMIADTVAQDSNARFKLLKQEIFSEPYGELPQYKVNRQQFGSTKDDADNKLLAAARRTFVSTDDLITRETNQKLLNANGICFVGQWRITQDNEYTGLYKNGSTVSAVVRASVALSGTKQKNKRAFGMAIKLLPHDLEQQASLNAFVLHSMGGTITKHVLDLSLDNEPPLGRLPRFSDIRTALRLQRDLEKADEENGATKPDVSFRPVSVFAEYGVQLSDAISPRWLRLSALDSERIDQDDFRNELRTEQYQNKKIIYQIAVAGNNQEVNAKKKNTDWQNIGILELTESVTSKSCDINLHFQHPKLKSI